MINFYRNKNVFAISRPKIATRVLDGIFNTSGLPLTKIDASIDWTSSNWFNGGKAMDVEVNSLGELDIVFNNSDGRVLTNMSIYMSSDLEKFRVELLNKIISPDNKNIPLYLLLRDPERRFMSGLYQELYMSISNHVHYMNGNPCDPENTLYQYTKFSKETIESDSELKFLKRYEYENIIEMSPPRSNREQRFIKKIIQQWLSWFFVKPYRYSTHIDNYLIDYLLILDYMKSSKNIKLVNSDKTDVKLLFEKYIDSNIRKKESVEMLFQDNYTRNTSNNWLKDILLCEIENNIKISAYINNYLSNEIKIYQHLIKKYDYMFV